MVNAMSDPIISDPRAFFDLMFGSELMERELTLDTEVLKNNGTPPSMESDLRIPKSFEDAFADPTQLEKVLFATNCH